MPVPYKLVTLSCDAEIMSELLFWAKTRDHFLDACPISSIGSVTH